MWVPHLAVVLSTAALTSALPRVQEGRTLGHKQRSEYYPVTSSGQQQGMQYNAVPSYPNPMVNSSSMTIKCMSEGFFPHPHNCTWFYRCHDRIGRSYFTASYYVCQPGTEFDDDLDQCIPKSGTCDDGLSVNFCRTLRSSCRICNVGSKQQELCKSKECYSGGRDLGIQRLCEQGQLHNGQYCLEESVCQEEANPPRTSQPWVSTTEFSPPTTIPSVVASLRNECPLNNLRSTAKWTDQASGCSKYTGCRADRYYQETLCSSYYNCREGKGILRYCPDGYLFSPQWELCIQPLQARCPSSPALEECPQRQGVGKGCQEHTGCLTGGIREITKRLCDYYVCAHTRAQKFSCQGADQLFNPDTKTCQRKLSACPRSECLPENAIRWESCTVKTGYRSLSIEKHTELHCQEYSCSYKQEFQSCGFGREFDPSTKSCVSVLIYSPIDRSDSCTPANADKWSACTDFCDKELCYVYTCTSSLNKRTFCNDQLTELYDPQLKRCVPKPNVNNCTCTVDQASFWGDCNDITGCTAYNQTQRTENQCQTYQCSITGQEFRCEGGQVFSPDQRSCVEPLNVASCPCTVDRVKFWGDCKDVTGCTADNQSERTENQCQTYQCSISGQEFRCEGGQVFSPDQRSCVEPLNAASCPCTVDRAKFWGDCKDVTGCTADNQSEQTVNQCQTYQCSITGQEFRCEGGLVFSPDQRSCVEPLNDASCPCTIDRAQSGRNCKTVTGCTPNNQTERTEEQCEHFQCSNTGQEISCEGGQVFSPEQRSCVEPLNPDDCPTTPEICTPAQAKKWTTCQDFCDNDLGSKTEMCYFFSCSETADWKKPHKISCNDQFTELFDPTTKTCTPKRNECPRAASPEIRAGCSPNRAILWYDCSTYNACIDDRYPQQQQSLCGQYSCEGEKITCSDGQMYDSEKSVCVTPLTGKYCLDGDRPKQPKVAVKSWNNQWN